MTPSSPPGNAGLATISPRERRNRTPRRFQARTLQWRDSTAESATSFPREPRGRRVPPQPSSG